MLVGYARVSTRDQSPVLQLDALHEAGCERVFTEKASGAARDRPELKAALAGLAKAKALGRRGGRKPTMGPAEIKRAKAMLGRSDHRGRGGGAADRGAALHALSAYSRRAKLAD